MRLLRSILVALVIPLLFVAKVQAFPLDEACRAYNNRDYEAANNLFQAVLFFADACGESDTESKSDTSPVTQAENTKTFGDNLTETPDVEQTDATKAANALIADISEPWTGDLSGMAERRVLRVLLPYSMPFFFHDKGHEKGINYEFLTRFEDFLNGDTKEKKGQKPTRLKVVLIPTPREFLLTRLIEGQGDLVTGNLTITDRRQEEITFSNPWISKIEEYVVTPASTADIHSVDQFSGQTIHVRQSSSYWESLNALNEQLKADGNDPVEISLADEYLEDEDLVEMVNAGALPAIVMDSHKAKFWAQVFDNIKVHEEAPLRSGGEIAWAFRNSSPELADKVNAYIDTFKAGTELGNIVLATYLKRQNWLKKLNDEGDRKKFVELIELFSKYGETYDINWLILAAKAYQESRFDNSARFEGAVGIMQIKPSTAESPEIGITEIGKLENNIHAGTKYVRFLMDKYYADLSGDPLNQTLIAFAGYNAGPERIAKLRKGAKDRGLDETKWFNNVEWIVAEEVGPITVNYVRNIFQYFIIYSAIYERHVQREELKN